LSNSYDEVATYVLRLVATTDLHGDVDHGNTAEHAGFQRKWKLVLRRSRWDGKMFYGIPEGM